MSTRVQRRNLLRVTLLLAIWAAGGSILPASALAWERPRVERHRVIDGLRAQRLEARRQRIEARRARIAARRAALRAAGAEERQEMLQRLEESIAASAAAGSDAPPLSLDSDRRRSFGERAAREPELFRERLRSLDSIPAARRAELRAAARRWLAASPDRAEALREKARRFRELPPEEQEALRERWRALSTMSPEQRRRSLEDALAAED